MSTRFGTTRRRRKDKICCPGVCIFNVQATLMDRFILMLEEVADDRYITREALQELHIDVAIRFVSESTELFATLAQGEMPALILADYNTAPDNALEVLRKLKDNKTWCDIPVVILSENGSAIYRKSCYAAGASTFVTKPLNSEQTRQKIKTFFSYWLEVAEI